MIEVYKIIHGLDNVDHSQFFNFVPSGPNSNTRGHQYKIARPHVRTEKRKNFFSIRIIKIWNELPAEVVNSSSLNIFKSKYDKYTRLNTEPERT